MASARRITIALSALLAALAFGFYCFELQAGSTSAPVVLSLEVENSTQHGFKNARRTISETARCSLESSSPCKRMTDGLFAFQECSNPAEEVIGWMSCGFSDDLTFGTAMCCPILDYPRECVWRGGETDGSKVCNPQCWEDEIALMSSASGGGFNVTTDLKTCEFGHKLFCCKSGHWRQLVELGHLSDCNEPCGAGYTTIASVKDPRWCNEPNTVLNDPKQARQVCSPNPVKFQKCQWRGTGNCELNNACEVGEYEYMRNLYDDAGKKCSTRNRDKALCCTVEGESAFDPVPIDDLIDTISLPATNLVSFELQELHDPENTEYLDPSEDAFAWLWLSGPPSVFTSLRSKRDGSMSDLAFLDCNMTLGEPQHTIRFVCTADNGTKDPDCDRMMRYGLQGKLVELPSRCTVAKYAVADTVQIAADQTLPDWLSYIQNKTVLELVYHLDFGHIKRDSGNIGFRLDFDNVGHMWKGVVDASSVKKRSLLARFISYSLEAWQDKFALWRGYPGVGTEFRYDFNKTFVSRGYEVCATGPPAYTVIRGRGTVEATIKTGITMYGILGPKLNVQHASVFTEATISSELVLDVAVSGRYSTWGAQTADLWNGFTYDTFSHPGIIEISPFLRGQIRLDVNIQMRANFTAGLKSYTGEGGNVIQAWPSNIFGPVGQTYIASIDSGFTGSITSIKETDSLRVDIRPIAGVDIKFSPISSGTKKREIPFDQPTVYTYHNQFLALQVAQFHLQGAPAVLDVPNQWTASINGTPIVGDLLALQGTDALPLVGQVGSDFFIGIPPASLQVATGGAGDPDPGNGSSIQSIVVDDDSLFKEGIQQCALDDIEYCPYETVTCAISACELYPGSCEQNGGEEDGSPSNDTVSHVGPNPPRRDLLLKFKDGTTMNLRPLDNPPAGKIFNTVFGDDVLRAGFSFISRSDCSNPDIFDDPITSGKCSILPTIVFHKARTDCGSGI